MSRGTSGLLGLAATTTCLLVLLDVALLNCAVAPELYSDKYDGIDVQAILDNQRLRESYFNCFTDKELCRTPDAKFFKEKFPESIVTQCQKCTSKQRKNFEKIVLYYTEKEPERWKEVLTKAITSYKGKSQHQFGR